MKSLIFKVTLCTALLGGVMTVALAQKGDEMQGFSMSAPHSIKIDGKNVEWKDTDFSYSKTTGLSYIICNDDKNLYLIIRSTYIANNTKILEGGITFSVNPDGRRKEKESITLTYPLVDQVRRARAGGVVISSPMRSDLKDPKQEAIIAGRQKNKLDRAKEIKINGFKNTTDTLISIYNDLGIKTFAKIEKDNSFFYELAIPLEALGISVKKQTAFAYNVKVNGLQMPGLDNREIVVDPPGGGSGNFDAVNDFRALTSSTDFWGKYKLAKY